jgi:hypothetical protein
MKRALLATAAIGATAALLAPLGSAAPQKNNENPDLTIQVDPQVQQWPRKVTVTGHLKGPDNANKEITLQADPFPFTQGPLKNVDTTMTDANGDYTFTPTPQEHTNYRTVADTKPKEISGVVTVRSRVLITRHVSDRTPVDESTITFFGNVGPAHEGEAVLIQRRRPSGTWKKITSATLGPEQSGGTSAYSTEIVIHRDGRWRAKFKADADHRGNKSHSIRINVLGQ